MNWRRVWRRRSRTEWMIRGGLVIFAAWAGGYSTLRTVASAMPGSAAAQAYQIAPGDPRIAAALAAQLVEVARTPAERARTSLMARGALAHDLTAIDAVTTLGVNALVAGNKVRARQMFMYAEQLSRRDLRVQLWAIEDAVVRGDVATALRHYDIALRTKSQTPELLFPILSATLGDPAIRSELVRTLAAQPLWTQSFLDYVGGHNSDPTAAALFLADVSRRGVGVPDAARANVVGALIAGGNADEAWRYYSSFRRGAVRNISRDATFTASLDTPTPFDWTPGTVPGVSASLQRSTSGGLFDFAAPPSVGGVLLSQQQKLPPGVYSLEGHSLGIQQAAASQPYWQLKCRDGVELGRVAIPNSDVAGGRFLGFLTVPAACAVQILALVAQPSTDMAGVSGQIDRVILRPRR